MWYPPIPVDTRWGSQQDRTGKSSRDGRHRPWRKEARSRATWQTGTELRRARGRRGLCGPCDRGVAWRRRGRAFRSPSSMPHPQGVWRNDRRASAIAAAAATRMLEHLDCWEAIAPEAQAITEMIVTDSRTSDPVRPVFLTFDGEITPGEPFAHMVPNVVLNGALRRARGGTRHRPDRGRRRDRLRDRRRRPRPSTLPTARRWRRGCWWRPTACSSRLRDMAGIKTVNWDYGQSGIVCTVAHERPHNGRAEEHFLPAGPFATLPLKPGATAPRSSGPSAPRMPTVWSSRRSRRLRDRTGTALRPEAGRNPRRGQAARMAAGADPGARFRAAAFRARGRCRARHSPHCRPGAQSGLQGRRSPRRSGGRGRPAGPGHRRARPPAALRTAGGASTRCRWAITTDVLNRLFSNDIGPLRARARRRAGAGGAHAEHEGVLHPPGGRSVGQGAEAAARRSDLNPVSRSAHPLASACPTRRAWRPRSRPGCGCRR